MAFVCAFLGSSSGFPERVQQILSLGSNLKYRDRLAVCVFLRCNGVPTVHIMNVLMPRLRDRLARLHVQNICADIDSGSHSDSWFYYDMHAQAQLYVKSRRPTDDNSSFHRGMYEWGQEVKRIVKTEDRYPSLWEQRRFFSEWFGPFSSLAQM